MEKEEITRQFHVPHGSPLANRAIGAVSEEFGVIIESLDSDNRAILEEGSTISVSGAIDNVHVFIDKIFGW